MGRPAASSLDGILLVDKPAGWTSHDVVARVRRLTGQRRTGHTGTLDPAATGLLVVCLGKATRLVEYMTGHDKRYLGRIQFGVSTSTDDAEGETISEQPMPTDWATQLELVGPRFVGNIIQRPPAYSALSVDGKRAYARARAGEKLDLPGRPVTIHHLTLQPEPGSTALIDVRCGSGTYLRSLARDIGEAIGCGGHLSALRRYTVGGFAVHDAWTLAELEALAEAGRIEEAVLPCDDGVADLDAAILTVPNCRLLSLGQHPQAVGDALRPAARARIYSGDGQFVGMANVGESGQIRALKVLFAAET